MEQQKWWCVLENLIFTLLKAFVIESKLLIDLMYKIITSFIFIPRMTTNQLMAQISK